MRRDLVIDRDPLVRRVARSLGVSTSKNLRDAISVAAVRRVEDWMERLSIRPRTLGDVHQLVLNRTRVKIIRVERDEDLELVAREIRKTAPAAPAQLELEFARDTEAVVLKQQDARSGLSSSFVAVVDARGPRASRAWFAERHEPAHILIGDPGADQVWRRTKRQRPEPIEQVVDAVASAVGFWRPIAEPVLLSLLATGVPLLDSLAAARNQLAPTSSREAAYRALVGMLDRPALVLRTDCFSRREDEEPGRDPMKSFALRAQVVVPNAAAQRVGMMVWQRFRIPADSVIARTADDWTVGTLKEEDDLGRWRSESGRTLAARRVRVTSRGQWATIEAMD